MEMLADYGLFLAKTVTVIVAILTVVVGAGAAATAAKGRGGPREKVEVRNLNQRYEQMADALRAEILPKRAFRQERRKRRRQRRKTERGRTDTESRKRCLFVLDFHGDIRASAVSALREEVTSVLTVAQPDDEVLIRLESAGGLVHAYGLAASQLVRIKERDLPLTVAVDKVAASGGYMMACVADRILAAPFAVLGSIGVVSQLPNFHRLLKRHNVDFELFTAGEFKRTVTLFGENTEDGRRKHQSDIEDLHTLFKDFVKERRPQVDIDRVSTGEHWFGRRALDIRLVDELKTSDDYLLSAHESSSLFSVRFISRKGLAERVGEFAHRALHRGVDGAV